MANQQAMADQIIHNFIACHVQAFFKTFLLFQVGMDKALVQLREPLKKIKSDVSVINLLFLSVCFMFLLLYSLLHLLC